jgi:hypothetical protein
MKGQVNVCRARPSHSNHTALSGSMRSLGRNEVGDPAPTLRRTSVLALAGAAVVLLGCQQDPVGTAPGGLEPSASSQQSEDRDDTSPGAGPSSDPGSETDDSGEGDAGDGASGGASGSGSGGSGSGRGSSGSGSGSGSSGSGSGSGGAG